MVQQEILSVFFLFYMGTLVLNSLIAGAQYYTSRNRATRTILFYWIGSIVGTVPNIIFQENGLPLIMTSFSGVWVLAYCLGSFFAELHDIRLNPKPLLIALATGLGLTLIMAFAGLSFTIYAYPLLLGASMPVAYSIVRVLREKKRTLTFVQTLFVATVTIYWFHWLDWPVFRTRPDWLLIGFWIALIIIHVLSVLTPFMAGENTLRRRNEQLEDDVVNKALQLTMAEQKLWESNKLASLGRLAGGVAHEINNPLQSLMLHIDNLSYHAEQPAPTNSLVLQSSEKMRSLIQRISKITQSLRKVARDSQTSDIHESDLVHVTKDAINLCEERIKNLGVKFTVDLPDTLPIQCNPIEISQVIMNLLNNAIDAVEEKAIKEISVALKVVDGYCQLSVVDSGYLDRALVDRLMDPFFTTKPIGKGMGLGLSIAKSIAESHHGRLSLDLQSPQTKFVFELPTLNSPARKDNLVH